MDSTAADLFRKIARMAEERTFGPTPAQVTIGFVDGHEAVGHLVRFAPRMPDLHLVYRSASDALGPFPTETVAYVGFHRTAHHPGPTTTQGEVKVHISGYKTFLVNPCGSDTDDPVGFYALPAVTNSPFRELFFFRHGVRLLEVNLPFGEMLVREGKVGSDQLQQALSEQQRSSRIPIGQILIKNHLLDEAQLRQAISLQRRRGQRMGEVLVEAGLVTPEHIEMALNEQRRGGVKRIGQILIGLGLLTELDMSTTLAKKFGLPFAALEKCHIDRDAISELAPEFIHRHKVLPIGNDHAAITLALADPLAIDTIDLVRMYTKKKVYEVVAMETQLQSFIAEHVPRTLSLQEVAG